MSFSRILGLSVLSLVTTTVISVRSVQSGDFLGAYLAIFIGSACALLCCYLHIRFVKPDTKPSRFRLKVRRQG